MTYKKVLLFKNAWGPLPMLYPVFGVSYWGRGGIRGYPCPGPGWGGEYPCLRTWLGYPSPWSWPDWGTPTPGLDQGKDLGLEIRATLLGKDLRPETRNRWPRVASQTNWKYYLSVVVGTPAVRMPLVLSQSAVTLALNLVWNSLPKFLFTNSSKFV